MEATAIPAEVIRSFVACFPGRVPTFFTDGGCQFPQLPSARFAAYAVVLDFSDSSAERFEQVQRFHATECLPSSLKVVAQGRVPGLQNIHRAELLSVVLVLEATPEAICYRDSQLTIDAIAAIRQSASVHELMNHPQFDLIVRAFVALTPQHDIRKVKAHQTIPRSLDFEDAYVLLGNRLADKVASTSVSELLPGFADDLRQQAAGIQRTQDMYHCFLKYVVDLQTCRARALQGEDFSTATNQGGLGPFDPVQCFSNWQPETVWPQPESWDLRWVSRCAWGAELVDAACNFLSSCEWPNLAEVHGAYPVGITWVEIALELMFWYQEYIPVRRRDAGGELHLIRLRSWEDVQLQQVTLQEVADNVSMFFSQLQALCPTKLWPENMSRCHVKSLYLLGDQGFLHGFSLRPRTVYQSETVLQTQLWLQSGRKMPNLGFDLPSKAVSPSEWPVRLRIAKRAMTSVRQVRKQQAP
eukprot:Skav216836  [mRNA]  locus=scaffold1340:175677:177086:+ [translate_table: standard]